MRNKTTRANNSFMLGSFVMMLLVFIVVFVFLMWSFKIMDHKEDAVYKDTYRVVLDKSVLNRKLSVMINDSLLFSGTPQAVMTLSVGKFSEQSALMAVDLETEQTYVFELPEKSARVTLLRDGEDFAIDIDSHKSKRQ